MVSEGRITQQLLTDGAMNWNLTSASATGVPLSVTVAVRVCWVPTRFESD